MQHSDILYDKKSITFLELVWGKGFLSPGGPDEVARLLSGIDLSNKTILDIGCGAGGIAILLARDYAAGKVVGIDVEQPVCDIARKRVQQSGLDKRIKIRLVSPGPLVFLDEVFDIVFSKDSIIHIPDKIALANEAFRVLRPGGWFVASDWLIAHDDEPSAQMQRYTEQEGLDFAMASPGQYHHALQQAGFTDIVFNNRNTWYTKQAKAELAILQGKKGKNFAAIVGEEIIKANIKTWRAMLKVLESKEHCPHHFRGKKPAV